MPICLPNEPDAIIWKHNKDGNFTIKSCYFHAMETLIDNTTFRVSGSLNSIRDLNLFQKMKIFLWRISRESLPARQRLSTKGVQCPITCASCGNCPETYHHAFVGCCNVEPVWEKASLWHIINTVRNTVDDMKSLIFHILKTCSPTQVEKFVAILCVLWRRRTEQVWDIVVKPPNISAIRFPKPP